MANTDKNLAEYIKNSKISIIFPNVYYIDLVFFSIRYTSDRVPWNVIYT